MKDVLETRNVAKHFGGLEVLRDVSFTLSEGERVALIGPNGAGKTTLINVLNGLTAPTSGSIHLLGNDVTRSPAHARVALGLSRSFQVNSLLPALSLFENVLMALYGVQKRRYEMFRSFTGHEDNNQRARKLLESIALWEKADMPVRELSHGEKRRLEIILSVSSEPKLLLLDEPNAGLDGAETSGLIHTIENLAAGTTTLVVAHDLDFVYRLCSRVLVLYYGEIIADGSCGEIRADETVRSIYLGTEVRNAGTR
ncbi:MAG: ABC transporter ATP-binding protein [Thermodesulfobacteriota bacterium]